MHNTDAQTLRAAANALWRALRSRRWEPRKETRVIHPTGNPSGHRYTVGRIPGPEPTLEVLANNPYLEATATSSETRLGFGIAIELTRENAHRALARLPAAVHAEYEDALDDNTLRFQKPFVWKGAHYRRNDQLHPRAATALEAIAAAASVRRLTAEENAELLDAHGINPAELDAILERTS